MIKICYVSISETKYIPHHVRQDRTVEKEPILMIDIHLETGLCHEIVSDPCHEIDQETGHGLTGCLHVTDH